MPLEPPSYDLIQAIEEVAVESCLAWEPWPKIEVCKRPGLLRIASEIPSTLFNCVLKSRLSEGEAGLRIEEIKSDSASRGVPISWYVTPLSRPSNLGELLLERGFVLAGGDLAFSGSVPGTEPEAVPGLSITKVDDREDLLHWSSINTTAFGFPPSIAICWIELSEAVGLDGPWRHYLARLDGRPVGTSSLFMGRDTALVANVAVHPSARRRKVATSLTAATLRDARRMGVDRASIFSSEMGEGVYRRLGFEEVCQMYLYIWSGENLRGCI